MSIYDPNYYSFDDLSSDYGSDPYSPSISDSDLYSFALSDPELSSFYGDSGLYSPSSWSADTPDWLRSFDVSPYNFSFDYGDLGQMDFGGTPLSDFSYGNFNPDRFDLDRFDPDEFARTIRQEAAAGNLSPEAMTMLGDRVDAVAEAQQESENELALGAAQAESYFPGLRTPIKSNVGLQFLGQEDNLLPVKDYAGRSVGFREGSNEGVTGYLDPWNRYSLAGERPEPSVTDFLGSTPEGRSIIARQYGNQAADSYASLYGSDPTTDPYLGTTSTQYQREGANAEEGLLAKMARRIAGSVQSKAGQAAQRAAQGTTSGGQGTTGSPSVASGALNALSAALAAYNAMKKDAGMSRDEFMRRSTVRDSGPQYGGTRPVRTMFKKGGVVPEKVPGGLSALALRIAQEIQRLDEAEDQEEESGKIDGMGGGQDDVVDVRAAPGEYVFDADIVSAIGDGNTEEGARKLDGMRERIRKHKRSAGSKSIPPKSKSIEQYLKG